MATRAKNPWILTEQLFPHITCDLKKCAIYVGDIAVSVGHNHAFDRVFKHIGRQCQLFFNRFMLRNIASHPDNAHKLTLGI